MCPASGDFKPETLTRLNEYLFAIPLSVYDFMEGWLPSLQ